MSDSVTFKNFTKERKPVLFELDGETYSCYSAIAPASLQELAVIINDGIDHTKAVAALTSFFEVVMFPDSFKRVVEKMADKIAPLDTVTATEIMLWLLEVYGLRPTQSSSDSSDGSPTDDAGTPSTDGA